MAVSSLFPEVVVESDLEKSTNLVLPEPFGELKEITRIEIVNSSSFEAHGVHVVLRKVDRFQSELFIHAPAEVCNFGFHGISVLLNIFLCYVDNCGV